MVKIFACRIRIENKSGNGRCLLPEWLISLTQNLSRDDEARHPKQLLNNKLKMEAMKSVRSVHVFDLKLLKEFYLVFGIYCKIHSIREISIGRSR